MKGIENSNKELLRKRRITILNVEPCTTTKVKNEIGSKLNYEKLAKKILLLLTPKDTNLLLTRDYNKKIVSKRRRNAFNNILGPSALSVFIINLVTKDFLPTCPSPMITSKLIC